MPLPALAEHGLAILLRSPELRGDAEGEDNPIEAWSNSRWFRVEDNRFVPRLPIPQDASAAFQELTRELMDYRLARYRNRPKSLSTQDTR